VLSFFNLSGRNSDPSFVRRDNGSGWDHCTSADDGSGADFAKVRDDSAGPDLGSGADDYVSADCRTGANGDEIADSGSGDEDVSVDVGMATQPNLGADGAIRPDNGPARGPQIVGDGRRWVNEGDSAFRSIHSFPDH
jgi:hypothetical protein